MEYHVEGRVHSYAQPTIYRWGDIASGRFDGYRAVMDLREVPMVTPRKYYLLGGIHMTQNNFVPNMLLKVNLLVILDEF